MDAHAHDEATGSAAPVQYKSGVSSMCNQTSFVIIRKIMTPMRCGVALTDGYGGDIGIANAPGCVRWFGAVFCEGVSFAGVVKWQTQRT
jgi:hypothetical protein